MLETIGNSSTKSQGNLPSKGQPAAGTHQEVGQTTAPAMGRDEVQFSAEFKSEHHEPEASPGFLSALMGGWSGGSDTKGAITQALGGEGQGSLTNGDGQDIQFGIVQSQGTNTHNSYSLSVGEADLAVNIDKDLDNQAALGRLADFYSQLPAELRPILQTVNVEEGRNPTDAEWAARRNMPGFRSAAEGAGGEITFFNGLRNVTEDVFNHEFGHNLGGHVRALQDQESQRAGRLAQDRQADVRTGDALGPNVPRGYSEAAQADGNSVSSYGDRAIGEDFADFYEAFRAAEERGPRALARFQATYPQRYQLLLPAMSG